MSTVKKSQQLLRDKPLTALQTAKFWVEYVLRHKGAPHMQSPAPQMSVIAYYNIDAYIILISAVILSIIVPIMVTAKILSKMFGSKQKVKVN